MTFIAQSIIQTSPEAAVPGAAFDVHVEDTIGGLLVSLARIPTPRTIADVNPSCASATMEMVWQGSLIRLTVACVDAPVPDFGVGPTRLELNSAASIQDSRPAVEVPEPDTTQPRTSAVSFAGVYRDMEGGTMFPDPTPRSARVVEICKHVDGGRENLRAVCRGLSQRAWVRRHGATENLPTLTMIREVAGELENSLAASVDTGPRGMEGASLPENFVAHRISTYSAMQDWNDLLEAEDQLGPLPKWKNDESLCASRISGQESALPEIVYGTSLMEDMNKFLGEHGIIEDKPIPVEMANTVNGREFNDPNNVVGAAETVIFCGAARVYGTDDSPSSGSRHRRRRKSSVKKNPENFKRERSSVPHGGWFRATTEPPSPGTAGTSSSSTSNARRSRSGRSNLSTVIGELKIKKPFTYDGRDDLDVLDQWTYEVDTWQELHGIDDEIMVKLIVNFMSGKASRFFMKHVALRQRHWTPKLIYEALFNYCFPSDFKLKLREQLTGAKQGKNDVRDFQRDLETLAARFPDVTERQIRQIFWTGIRTYLRMHLIGKGLDPERSSIEKLVKHAARAEAARQAWKRENAESMHPMRYHQAGAEEIVSKSEDMENSESSEADEEGTDSENPSESHTQESELEISAANIQRAESSQTGGFGRGNHPFLPRAEFERLRCEGRCFNCKTRGHLSRDCTENGWSTVPEVSSQRDTTEVLEAQAVRYEYFEDSPSENSESADESGGDDDVADDTGSEQDSRSSQSQEEEGEDSTSEGDTSEADYQHRYPWTGYLASDSDEE
ncbi:hypothetical protein FB45DRAFT_1042043 [Roridomyces roridus]|uniref:CCHC-type domain-containing protein n=1 Tax=Roridomyces roridus TaxID=1738132 RepID=A0AAD7AZJ2_9AGAR|nr:hypothetical protein FB45DRAFT_1042043 [Roridomyces roridus]